MMRTLPSLFGSVFSDTLDSCCVYYFHGDMQIFRNTTASVRLADLEKSHPSALASIMVPIAHAAMSRVTLNANSYKISADIFICISLNVYASTYRAHQSVIVMNLKIKNTMKSGISRISRTAIAN